MPIPGQGFVAWRHHPKHGSVAMIRVLMVGAAVAIAVTTASAQSTGRGSERKPAVAPRRTTSVRISVRDPGRATLAGVHLLLSGAAAGAFSTGADGTTVIPNLKDGLYRVRCERAVPRHPLHRSKVCAWSDSYLSKRISVITAQTCRVAATLRSTYRPRKKARSASSLRRR